MKEDLIRNLHLFPNNCAETVLELAGHRKARFLVRSSRRSKLGDFRPAQKGREAVITVNGDLNPYHFIIIFLHELAHLEVWENSGPHVQAHGKEWKEAFSSLVQLFYIRNTFPLDLDLAIRGLIDRPRASSFADTSLLQALRRYDGEENKSTILDELEEDAYFRLKNGKIYKKLEKRRSRILCAEVGSRKKYLIHKMAEVEAVDASFKN